MPNARTLIHTVWFDFAINRLAGAVRMDEMLGRELYRLSLYADLIPPVPDGEPLRIYRTTPFVRDDGHLVRLWIYFTLPDENSVELLHIEAIEEDMDGATSEK